MEITSSEDNKASRSYIVFFDLDGTIIAENSGIALVRQAYHDGLMSRRNLLKALSLSVLYKLSLWKEDKIIRNMVTWVRGYREELMTDLSRYVYEKILVPSIHRGAAAEMETHRGKGAKLVILSSSIRHACTEVANHLGMDDIVCSDLEIAVGSFTGFFKGEICIGDKKAARLKEYCEKNNCRTGEAWYYGDSFQDLPALSIVGHPVCVNPGRKLKAAARRNGWDITSWK
jgi:putative phosphoserine phosphatase / 1-acylglycerol-3-phosphate O-acyltransferase